MHKKTHNSNYLNNCIKHVFEFQIMIRSRTACVFVVCKSMDMYAFLHLHNRLAIFHGSDS